MEQVKRREDYHLQAAWFAAGAAVLAVCWQRAALGSVFERWRMWVFFALNVLLLAILFTSAYSTTTATPYELVAKGGKEKKESTKRKKQSRVTVLGDEGLKLAKKSSEIKGVKKAEMVEGEDGAIPNDLSLSKEELNERVEAFIAMFKQQLISDAKLRNGIS